MWGEASFSFAFIYLPEFLFFFLPAFLSSSHVCSLPLSLNVFLFHCSFSFLVAVSVFACLFLPDSFFLCLWLTLSLFLSCFLHSVSPCLILSGVFLHLLICFFLSLPTLHCVHDLDCQSACVPPPLLFFLCPLVSLFILSLPVCLSASLGMSFSPWAPASVSVSSYLCLVF